MCIYLVNLGEMGAVEAALLPSFADFHTLT